MQLYAHLRCKLSLTKARNHMKLSFCLNLCIALIGSLSSAYSAEQSRISMKQAADGTWGLEYGGEAFFVKGAGGQKHLDILVESGGNMIRTWGINSLSEKVA